jgi:hypothetical protein
VVGHERIIARRETARQLRDCSRLIKPRTVTFLLRLKGVTFLLLYDTAQERLYRRAFVQQRISLVAIDNFRRAGIPLVSGFEDTAQTVALRFIQRPSFNSDFGKEDFSIRLQRGPRRRILPAAR